jgi:hypothetical protein
VDDLDVGGVGVVPQETNCAALGFFFIFSMVVVKIINPASARLGEFVGCQIA